MVGTLRPISIHLRYFKGYAEAELTLTEPLTVLVGRNGAGKSNLLEGIHLLGQLASGRALREVDEPGRGSPCAVRGGLTGCTSLGERFFVLGCRSDDLTYEVALRPEVGLIEDESLAAAGIPLFQSIDRRTNFKRRVVQVRYNPEPADPLPASAPVESLPADRALLHDYPSFLERPSRGASLEVLKRVEAFKERLKNIHVFSPQPDAMRRYERVGLGIEAPPLDRDGGNLSAVLYTLSQGQPEDRQLLEQISQRLRQLPEEDFAGLDFLRSDGGDVMLGLRPAAAQDRGPAPLVDARLLSDGTLRYLAVLTALEVLPEGATLLLEDADAGLHPSRLGNLVTWLGQRCAARGLRAVVTTNAPTLLDALSDEQLRGVVLCFRDQRTGSSDLRPLLQIAQVDSLLERGSLGDLVTRQIIEQHLQPDFTERRRQNLLRWLAEQP